MTRFRPTARAPAAAVPLLDVDPDLSAELTDDQAAAARDALRVDAEWIAPGPIAPDRLPDGGAGVLVILGQGLVARRTTFERSVAAELIGPGGLLCPPAPGDQARLGLPGYTIEWTALATSLLAVLGPEQLRLLRDFPEVADALLARAERHLADMAAIRVIGQLTGVDRRLLALFRLLAARHGRETAEGVAVPVAVPHRLLAELVGVRRPTVTTALRQLAAAGELRRLDDGTWLVREAIGAHRHSRRPNTTAYVPPAASLEGAPETTAMPTSR